jgi:hypothetical protein
MSLAAKQIVMTKQATLGPIDPSVNNALNPLIPGGAPGARVPVSVEAVNGFMELAKAHSGKLNAHAVKDLLVQLSTMVHPLVLGEVYRSKAQIQMLATKLLSRAGVDAKSRGQIVSFLCSESGSHDYTIHRREAKELGLQIEKLNDEFYKEMKALYDDFAEEMQLTKRWDPNIEIGQTVEHHYFIKRCLIETTTGGSHFFLTEGKLEKKQPAQPPQPPGAPQPPVPPMQLRDNHIYEGWKYEAAPKKV